MKCRKVYKLRIYSQKIRIATAWPPLDRLHMQHTSLGRIHVDAGLTGVLII